jgi:phosphatidylinositol alpha-1,6-mannosyltransferase
MSPPEIVMVSAGLGLDGGGSAHLGRLSARALAALCRERRMPFRVLHLGQPTDVLGDIPVRHFAGRRRALAAAVAAAQLRRRRLALVFDHLGPARVQAFLPASWRRPYLLWMLGIEVWGPLSRDRRRALAGAAVRLAISEHTRRRALAALAASCAIEADVLHLTLEDRPATGEVDRALLDRLGEGYLLIVGRMAAAERYKGHDDLLAALPAVAAEHPGARLVVVGEGDDRARLAARAAALGVGGRVIFTGFVSPATLAEVYRRAGIFAMPSKDEGFGLVYLEAMRAGKPCVAAAGSAAAEIVADGDTGRLVAPGDTYALAAALSALLGDPRRAAQMGDNGRQRYRSQFAEEAFRKGLAAAFARLLEHVRD